MALGLNSYRVQVNDLFMYSQRMIVINSEFDNNLYYKIIVYYKIDLYEFLICNKKNNYELIFLFKYLLN